MRVRTGHGPQDWSDNLPGCHARITAHTGASIHGEIVRGGESEIDRQRRQQREHMRRFRSKPVDMNDYQRENRWEGLERCGKMMKQAKQPCARTAGHRRECKSAEAMEYSRTIRTGVA